ncbi:MAG TPA: IucA/IucC family C-terminal-domain containing protein [Bacillales bacterium]|nr:IucA/IucC family C-terminal-domain containing protein [Bacillales bacterium]
MNLTQCSLNREEAKLLKEHFRYDPTGNIHENSTPAAALSNRIELAMMLEKIGKKLNSPSPLVTASQFSKRYSFMVAVPALYAMAVFDKGMNATLGNCRIGPSAAPDVWMPHLQLDDDECLPAPLHDRHSWRDTIFKRLFKENLSIVNRMLTALTSVPETILWENTALYVFWLFEERMKQSDTPQAEQIKEDFHHLVFADEGEVFGKSANPLQPFYSRKHLNGVRVRQTCCLYYKLPEADFCSTCRKCWRNEPEDEVSPAASLHAKR